MIGKEEGWESLPNLTTRAKDCEFEDIGAVVGQQAAVMAALTAAAGRHNLFMAGSPGCGKTSIARALPGLLPPWPIWMQVTLS